MHTAFFALLECCAVFFTMRLICFWCFVVAAAQAQSDFYAPQTFRQNVGRIGGAALFQPALNAWGSAANKVDGYQSGLFSPAGRDGSATGSQTGQNAPTWSEDKDFSQAAKEAWGGPTSTGPALFPRQEPWRLGLSGSKEQQANILHHKQALTSDGAFRFEYASDNGLAAGEQIEPDGSRVGAYQYKDPSGQLVKLKYRAGKDGFQILEGSHLPKSPEPVAPHTQDNHYQQAYAAQKQQYDLQQQYNQQPREQQGRWTQATGSEDAQKSTGGQYLNQNWSQGGPEDDGQYREIDGQDKGPHTFGGGYAFSFQG